MEGEQVKPQGKYIWLIYTMAVAPLLYGSAVFFYWYCRRTWYAQHVSIEMYAFFALIGFLLVGSATLLFCLNFVTNYPREWPKILPPVFMIGLTVPFIWLIMTVHDACAKKAYVYLKNDKVPLKEVRVWSAHFEEIIPVKEKQELVFSYQPVYHFDWIQKDSFGYSYQIDNVYVTLQKQEGEDSTYLLPTLEKGTCIQISVSELKPPTPQKPLPEKPKHRKKKAAKTSLSNE